MATTMCRLGFMAIFATAVATAWPWPQQAIFPDQSRGNNNRPSAQQEVAAAGNASSSVPIDSGWLYRTMTQMAIDMHHAIVTGNQIRSCDGRSSSQSGNKQKKKNEWMNVY
jgi:hypothetical protein